MNDNVLDIPPAKFSETYSGFRISYTFIPNLKQWHWEFEVPLNIIRFNNVAVNRQAAIKAAHKQIDRLGKVL